MVSVAVLYAQIVFIFIDDLVLQCIDPTCSILQKKNKKQPETILFGSLFSVPIRKVFFGLENLHTETEKPQGLCSLLLSPSFPFESRIFF